MQSHSRYAGMQGIICSRDIALQGFINQSLTNSGNASEARECAGNLTPTDWVCLFKPTAPAHAL